MNLRDDLIRYKEYSDGDLSKKCRLEYEDIEITGFDFSEFDLNNSFFGSVKFKECDFSDVYLSGSNFGGSILEECLLKENENMKSTWDDMTFEKSQIVSMKAFGTTFLYGKFRNSNFEICHIDKCLFSHSLFDNVCFKECTLSNLDLTSCQFHNVQFVNCTFDNVLFAKEERNGYRVIFLKKA